MMCKKAAYTFLVSGILLLGVSCESAGKFAPIFVPFEDKAEKTEKTETQPQQENAQKEEKVKDEAPAAAKADKEARVSEAPAEKKNGKQSDKSAPDTSKNRQEDEAMDAPRSGTEKSELGHNALSRVFVTGFESTWKGVMETMLRFPVISIDKASGTIITDWIQDKGWMAGNGENRAVFEAKSRLVRYKYIVRVEDRGGEAEVTVIPYAQKKVYGKWLDAKPKIKISEKMMEVIIAKLEE